MPRSKKRGGQKAHNKRVGARNQKNAGEKKRLQQAYTEMFQQRLEEFQEQYSAMTESKSEVVETDVVMEGTTNDIETTIITDEQ